MRLNRLANTISEKEIMPDTYDKAAHRAHRSAAEQHDLAAQAHRTAAEHNEKGDETAESWHSQRALEYSDHAYKLAREAHNKSGKMETP
jgi:hypothetical protein